MARPIKDKEEDKTIIKQIMREKGITVKVLAERMGKATATVSNLLSNANMSISTLANMAQALDVEISDLFPVPTGYVHYMEAKNIAQNIRQEPQAVQTSHVAVTDDEMTLFQKFKAFMAQEKEDTLLVNNPAFMQ